MHIRISSTHARTPRVLKYLKRAGQGNIRVSLKNIVLKFRNILQERHKEYKYSLLEVELSRFFSLSKRFFPYNESFFPNLSVVEKLQRPARFRLLETHGFS